MCRTGKAAAGEKLFLEVARNPIYPTPEVALLNAGVCVGGAGDVVDAERYFKRALAIRPEHARGAAAARQSCVRSRRCAQALELVQRYLAVNAPSPEILWLGYRAERKLGDSTAAAVYARRVQTEFPEFRTSTDHALRRRSMSEGAQTLSLGQRLKAERERRGMSAQKAADEMHLDAWVIEALEADDYQRIGPPVYAKGHLKKYASILGLPAAEMLSAFGADAPSRPRGPLHRRASGCRRRLRRAKTCRGRSSRPPR